MTRFWFVMMNMLVIGVLSLLFGGVASILLCAIGAPDQLILMTVPVFFAMFLLAFVAAMEMESGSTQ